MTIQERLHALCAEATARGADSYRGNDWCELNEAEEEIFAIPRERFPVLVVAWQAYQAFCGVIDAEDAGLDDDVINAARAKHPDLYSDAEMSNTGFQRLAAEWCGVSNREAHAMYCKTDLWNIRNGLVRYVDEG
jgi:hypothetical protein